MRDYNTVKFVPNVFTPQECDRIIALGKRQPLKPGTVYQTEGPDEVIYKQLLDNGARVAENWAFPEDGDRRFEWIRERMFAASRKINESFFEFDLTTDHPDRMLFVHYPLNGFFRPHVDNLGVLNGMYKKLTCVIQLSDPRQYVGGELSVSLASKKAPKARGTMIAFPTYISHWVSKVMSGERFILINWCVSERHFR